MRLSWQSLLGKTRPVLEQPGPTGCKSITPAGKLLFLGPGQTIPGTVESERVASPAHWSSHEFFALLCCFFSFLILDFSQFVDLTFMCDAEPPKANSMAFYRTDVVCFNCKQTPQQSLNQILQGTALMALNGLMRISGPCYGRVLPLPGQTQQTNGVYVNTQSLSMHPRVALHFLTHDWLPL